MAQTVLITGGAGFIGRVVAAQLLDRGDAVRVLDSLIPQVHGDGLAAGVLAPEVELIQGDVRDIEAVGRALKGVDKVVHLAAEVGVGQSMSAIDRYTSVNDLGTATLFQALIDNPVRRVVVASSMSIYGEGLYKDFEGVTHEDVLRKPRGPNDTSWDPLDASGKPMEPIPTPETKRPTLASVYAITKFVQERLTLTVAPAYGMEGTALRLSNAYGPGQALSTPSTGALAIFASRIANGKPPVIFEDGQQRRDFVHVKDVARAFLLAIDHPKAAGGVFNIGSGEDRSVSDVATLLAEAMGRPGIRPEIAGKARAGDIRHCIPDIDKAVEQLGYEPMEDFRDGLAELAEWVSRQDTTDRVGEDRKDLEARGIVA